MMRWCLWWITFNVFFELEICMEMELSRPIHIGYPVSSFDENNSHFGDRFKVFYLSHLGFRLL